jgi:fructan beta-fructosidase
MSSGSAVVDRDNTSSFGQPGNPLVAIYTGHYTTKPLQNQHIAFSTDRGRTWTKFSGNPVLDIGERDFRDPKVLWHEPTKRWVMTVAWPVQHKVRFYASPDLKAWTHLSDFGPVGATEGVWECPDLFPIDAGGKTRWVLIVNIGAGAPAGGSGCQYFVGDYDGHGFALDPSYPSAKGAALWADHAPDFYAAVSWSDVPKSDGRRLWLGWMAAGGTRTTCRHRRGGSIPRASPDQTPDGLRLAQAPARELETPWLRGSTSGRDRPELNAWLRRTRSPATAGSSASRNSLPRRAGREALSRADGDRPRLGGRVALLVPRSPIGRPSSSQVRGRLHVSCRLDGVTSRFDSSSMPLLDRSLRQRRRA